MSLRRALFRLTEIFDYRTFTVMGAFGTLCIAGFLVVTSAQTAHDALDAQTSSRQAATRRIDLLTREGARRDTRLAELTATTARQQLALEALSAQVRAMGGQPVVTPQQAARAPRTTTETTRPRPSPAPRASPARPPSPRASPSPSPSPTCTPLLPIVGCRITGRNHP